MADLADLDIPTLTQRLSKEESDNNENFKENDSPINQSHISHSEHTGSANSKETWTKKTLPSSRLMKESLNDAANILKNSKFDSKKSSTSSLNSVHRTSFSVDSEDARPLKPPVKPRSYDPEKAREYIRQQKQERLNRLREERERQQSDLLARKQKLDELSKTTSKLVKASLKRKSNHVNLTEDQIIEPARDFNLIDEKLDKMHSEVPNNPVQNDSLKRYNENPHQDLPERYTVSNIPTSLDDSNAQLIREICEMKTRIEVMAKSLKTTIISNRAKSGKTSSKRLESGKDDPSVMPSTLKSNESLVSVVTDSCVTKRTPASNVGHIPTEINGHIRLPSDPTNLDETSINSPYLQNLTSNLRKMRESLQTLLAQNEVASSASSEKTRANRSHPGRHQRFLSAGSDTAFEPMKIEANQIRVPSLDRNISTNLKKKQIATSFPSLPLDEPHNVNFERKRHLSTSSETGAYGKLSPYYIVFHRYLQILHSRIIFDFGSQDQTSRNQEVGLYFIQHQHTYFLGKFLWLQEVSKHQAPV